MSRRSIATRIARRLSIMLGREDAWLARNGTFREKESYGVIRRPTYCYGMLRAADQAKYLGREEVTVVEFGVASGAGLLNMIELGGIIARETGVRFHIVGFDAGGGLPQVKGYKDHAELWKSGDFVMQDRAGLMKRIDGQADLIFGDINDTVGELRSRLSPDRPLGFISVDVDIYTATVAALRCLEWAADLYLPGVSMYFDDTQFFFANEWAGELLAINEFNARSEHRKIGADRSLGGRPRYEAWQRAIYVCHILDHEMRNSGIQRRSLTIDQHHEFMRTNVLY
jgi:hypothetical protein